MNNYDKIKAYLNLGTLKGVEVTDERGNKYIVLKILNDKELLCVSGYEEADVTIKLTKKQSEDLTNITPIPIEPKILKEGTEVEVITEEYKGTRGTVTTSGETNYYFTSKDGLISECIPHYAVVPVLEEEIDDSQREVLNKYLAYNDAQKELEQALNKLKDTN